jgi:hypothetical protein
MADNLSIPKRIVVATHPKMPEAFKEAEVIAEHLNARGLTTRLGLLQR